MHVVYYLHMPCEPFRKARWNPGDEVCQCNVPVACVRHCRYYSQAAVLDKVPPCFLLLGVVQTSVQLLATLLICRPTPPQVSDLISGVGGLGQLSGQGSRASPNGCPLSTAAGLCQRVGRRQQHCSPVFCPWLLLTSLLSMVTAIQSSLPWLLLTQSSLHGYCSPVFSPWLLLYQSSLHAYCAQVFSPWLLLSSLLSMDTALQSSLHGYSPVFSACLLLSSLLSMVTLQSSLHGYCSPVFSPWLLLSSLFSMLLSSLLSMFTLQSSFHGCCSPAFSPWLLSSLLSMVTVRSSLHGYSPVFSLYLLFSSLWHMSLLSQCSMYCCCCPKRLTFVHLQARATIVSETEPLIPPERPKPAEPASINSQRSFNTDYEKEDRSCPVEKADVCPKEVLKSRVFWTLWVMMIVSELGTSFVVSLFKVSAALDVSVALFCVYPPPPPSLPQPPPLPSPARPSDPHVTSSWPYLFCCYVIVLFNPLHLVSSFYKVINLKRCKHLTDRTGHGGLTEEVHVLPCDDLSVNRKDTQLIVTDFIETAGRNGTILKGCRAGQNSGCVHSEENIGKYECRDESLFAKCIALYQC